MVTEKELKKIFKQCGIKTTKKQLDMFRFELIAAELKYPKYRREEFEIPIDFDEGYDV